MVTPVTPSTPMLQENNAYRIVVNARTGCENSLQGSYQYGQCSDQQNITILSTLNPGELLAAHPLVHPLLDGDSLSLSGNQIKLSLQIACLCVKLN